MGRAIADAILRLVGPAEDMTFTAADVYDPLWNPTGNRLVNGLFAGAGGSASANGITGTSATGWNVIRGTSSTITCAVSKEAVPSFANLSRQVYTFGGTVDGVLHRTTQSSALSLTGLSAGDYVQAEVAADFTGLTGFAFMALGVSVKNGSAVSSSRADGLSSVNNGAWPSTDHSILMRTEPLLIPSGANSLAITIDMQPQSSGQAGGSIKLSRARLRKL